MSCNKVEAHEVKTHEPKQHRRFAYFLAGIGIGAAASMFFAPKSGDETRKTIAKKVFDSVESANEKVWQSRAQVKEYIDQRQQQVSELVAVGRDAMGVPAATSARTRVV